MRRVALPLFLIVVLLASCKKEIAKNAAKNQDTTVSTTDPTTNSFTLPDTILAKYNNSYNACLDFKQKNNNSYVFVMRFDYVEPQFHTIITTKVQNGVVVSRNFLSITYVADPPNQLAKSDTTKQWHEEGSSLNTHAEAGPPMTLDYIYSLGKSTWLNVDPVKKHTFFQYQKPGAYLYLRTFSLWLPGQLHRRNTKHYLYHFIVNFGPEQLVFKQTLCV